MRKINYQTLREIAKLATQGEWVAFISPGTDTYAVHTPGDERCGDIIKYIEKYGFGEIFQRPSDKYEASRCVTPLYRMPPVPVVPEGLVKAVRFYEQVKRENPPVETGAWKDAVDWVLKEACQVVNIRIKGE
ncbi:ead/Ea22-like family protein [Escherichia coli]|uniref:ead/Ea22-like family protein n=1 Tax=Escherichia coli TaxID=562 RepID=UPI002104FA49|nr:ead/Ea22-like family protein [Escherichia coli]MCQ1933274.1 ead/Ea22-like family protein [Escherichia coli]